MTTATSARRLHLYLPDLFRHAATCPTDLELPHLNLALSRASCQTHEIKNPLAYLCDLFGLHTPKEQDLPIAALTHAYDCERGEPDSLWMRCDPVYLYADMDRLRLFGADMSLYLSQQEADQFVQELNTFYQQDGLEFIAAAPHRWYLRLAQRPALVTTALDDVIGQDIYEYMPEGEDELYWRRLANEIQMVLYQSPLNEQREAAQKMPVNGLWFWGVGALPKEKLTRWQQVWSDDAVGCGLAVCSDSPCHDMPSDAKTLLHNIDTTGDQLAVLYPHEIDDWAQWLVGIDQQWIQPCLIALKEKQIDQLWLHSCDGQVFSLTRSQLKRWWRRPKTWRSFIPESLQDTAL